MPVPTHIQQMGGLRAVLNSDGRKSLMLPTGSPLWIPVRTPYPEIDLGNFQKIVVNPNVFTSARIVNFAKVVQGNIVVGVRANVGNQEIIYSTNGGITWNLATVTDPGSKTVGWVKVIDDIIYSGGNVFRMSLDGGITWSPVDGAPEFTAGVAFDGVANYIALTGFGTAAQSIDGINWSEYEPTYNHPVISEGANFGVTFGLDYYQGAFWRTYGPHPHNAIGDNVDRASIFSSVDGITWNEIFEYNNFDDYPQGPVISIFPYLVTSPDLFHPTWLYNRLGTWGTNQHGSDDGTNSTNNLNSTADLIGGWVNYAHGRYWSANNYSRDSSTANFVAKYLSTDIRSSLELEPFLSAPVFTSLDWNVSAMCVDDNGDLLVFERSNADYGSVSNVTTRLSKIVSA